MTVTHRESGEVPVTIQIFLPFQCIDDNRAVRLLEIDHRVESVLEDVFFQDREDLLGRDFYPGHVALLGG
jgi:hypothetical protein